MKENIAHAVILNTCLLLLLLSLMPLLFVLVAPHRSALLLARSIS